jgi:hypothetical protein
MLKQIGMRAGAMECYGAIHRVNCINEYPIALNMTVKRPFPTAMKRVVITFRRQRLFIDDQVHNFNEFIKIHAALLHQQVLLSERFCINRFKHRLIVLVFCLFHFILASVKDRTLVILFKVFNYFRKGMKALCWNFSARNSHAFLNGGNSFGIVARVSGYWIAVCGTYRAFAGLDSCGSRGKGKNNPTRRYFGWYINNQPMAGGYFYGLRNAHGVNIA